MSHTHAEIHAQAEAWRSALDAVRAAAPQLAKLVAAQPQLQVVLLGSGSSYYLGLAAAGAWSRAGWRAQVLPSAEPLLHPSDYGFERPPLVLASSRSGATTETIRAAGRMRDGGSTVIGITTEPGSELAGVCDLLIGVEGGRERSTVQTRSFSGQLVAALALAFELHADADGLAGLERLEGVAPAWLAEAERTSEAWAGRFDRAYFLGTGARWGLAMEGALKLKEAALTEAEAFQTLEFRHGPQSMVDDRTLIVALVGDETGTVELEVVHEMRALGAQVLAIGESLDGKLTDGDGSGATSLSFRSGLPERCRLPLFLAPLQLLAYHRAVAKGLDPDQPRNLSFAVELANL